MEILEDLAKLFGNDDDDTGKEHAKEKLKTRSSKIRAVMFLWQECLELMNMDVPAPDSVEDMERVFHEHKEELAKRSDQLKEKLAKARTILETL